MRIRPTQENDPEVLLDVWWNSVRSTHKFVSPEDLQAFVPMVEDYLRSAEPELWVLCASSEQVMGFMGLSGNKIDALFLAPEFQRQGGGRRLVLHAQATREVLSVDVNEQNTGAVLFYQALGFVVEGRSGRPYPLLHMRRVTTSPSC